jgi:hypothetical protein
MKPEAPNEDQADMDHVARVLRLADERGDFVSGDDGYTYYWPSEASRGALPSWALRVLANEMDKRDTTWNAILNGDHRIGPPCLQVWRWDEAPEKWKKLSTWSGDEDWLALVPLVMLGVANEEPDLWWLRWHPEQVKRYKEGAPEGFEIWIGAHA